MYAAWAAAATSLATLLVTTVVNERREQRKWARGALTDAFVGFLEASWAHSGIAASASPNVHSMHSAYAEMRSQLTRLRLLASEDVLQVGEELLRHQKAVQDAPRGHELDACLQRAAGSRRRMVQAAKKEMGLS